MVMMTWQMGQEDLKAIGIDNQKDEEMILFSVKILREQGAAWVYLLLGDQEDGAGTSSSGKLLISEDEGFLFSTSRRESLGKEDFFLSCTNNLCEYKLLSWENVELQVSHLCGFFPSCTEAMCPFRSCLYPKEASQISQV